jgi:hypothetical protein
VSGVPSYKETNKEIESQGKTPAEQAFLTAVHQRNVIAEALKNGLSQNATGTLHSPTSARTRDLRLTRNMMSVMMPISKA